MRNFFQSVWKGFFLKDFLISSSVTIYFLMKYQMKFLMKYQMKFLPKIFQMDINLYFYKIFWYLRVFYCNWWWNYKNILEEYLPKGWQKNLCNFQWVWKKILELYSRKFKVNKISMIWPWLVMENLLKVIN